MALENLNLTGHFLIAMPNMQDSFFADSVTYICAHNEDGAMGVIINRPTEMSVEKLFEKINLSLENTALSNQKVLFGGPVQTERGFVLHTVDNGMHKDIWSSSIFVSSDIALTTSKDILEASAKGAGPEKMLLTLGYAGWTAGQLESEIIQNAWLSVQPKDSKTLTKILYEIDHTDKHHAAIELLGINPAMLSDTAGHA
jgi:putative transcriptional regulator